MDNPTVNHEKEKTEKKYKTKIKAIHPAKG